MNVQYTLVSLMSWLELCMTLEIPDSGWDLHHYSYRDCDFDMII